ncbi:MAG: hypothetical protein NUW23_05990 [Firmicutes bacterium]|jgi:hypothetical protein|nr:hypothetical protein [Bacillota bacterium]
MEERSSAEHWQNVFITAVAAFLVAVLSYAVFVLICPRTVGRFASSAVARRGSIENEVTGTGMIVRDERVVITPISGVVHFHLDDGVKTASGEAVAEIRDTALLSRVGPDADKVQKEVDSFVQAVALRERRERERLNAVRVQIAVKEEELRAYVERKDAKNANRIHDDLSVLRAQEAAIQASIVRTREEIESAQRAVAEAKRQSDVAMGRALAVLRSFEASLISRYTDGLEGLLRPDDPDLLMHDPSKLRPNPCRLEDGQYVAAGNAVFREIQNYRTHVVVFAEFPDGAPPEPGRRVRVRFPRLATEAVGATVLSLQKRQGTAHEWAVHVALDRYATSLTDTRFEEVRLVTGLFEGILVPAPAVVERGGSTGVYVLRSDRFSFREVEVLATDGESTVVRGITEGDRVLARP